MRNRRALWVSAALAAGAALFASRLARRGRAIVEPAPIVVGASTSSGEASSASAAASSSPPWRPPLPLPASAVVRDGPPAMLHLDPRRTNRSPYRAPRAPRVRWTYAAGGPVAAAPVVAGGRVVVASLSGRVAALDAEGKPAWTFDARERVYGSPMVVGDLVVVGVDRGTVLGLSASSGRVRFRAAVDGDADTGPAPLPDGGFVLAAGRAAHAFRVDGTPRWKVKSKRKLYASPAVADDGASVFPGQDDHVLVLDKTGAERFRVSVSADADASPAIADDGTIYVGTDAGEILALAPDDGRVLFRRAIGGFVRGALSVSRSGAVLASTYGPKPAVVALDGRDGALLFRFEVPGTGAKEHGVHGAPLEDREGTLVFGAQDDHVYALDGAGTLKWKVRLGGDVDQAVVLTEDGVLVVGAEDGTVTALVDGD